MRIKAYSTSYDQVDEYARVTARTSKQCRANFVIGIVSVYGDTYLKEPNQQDLYRLLHASNKRGFHGMIGSIDYKH